MKSLRHRKLKTFVQNLKLVRVSSQRQYSNPFLPHGAVSGVRKPWRSWHSVRREQRWRQSVMGSGLPSVFLALRSMSWSSQGESCQVSWRTGLSDCSKFSRGLLTGAQAWSVLVFFLFGFPAGWGSCSPLRFLRAQAPAPGL